MEARYSLYFGEVLRQNGIPNFSISQFQRMMNIVFLEGKLAAQDDFLKCTTGKDGQRDFNRLKFRNEQQMEALTRGKSPQKLLLELVQVSHKENSTEFDRPWSDFDGI